MGEAAKERYDQEQALLREQQGLSPVDEDLHIAAPQRAEVNPKVYRDVEPILFRGFLYVPAEINGVSFVFKSLNSHEFEMLGLFCQGKDKRQIDNIFLAYGVFMVDGVNILPDRENWISEVASVFEGLEEGARRKVIRYISEINRRANRAVRLTEVFSFEGTSRMRWAQCYNLDLTSPAITVVKGTEGLGLNWGQLTWRAVNFFEDRRGTSEQAWENAKFVASSMAGSKGMSKVNAQDKQRREREEKERYTQRDRILREVVLGEAASTDAKKGAPMKAAQTVEELADQLEKDLKGEKDFHDMVVDAHERRIRDARQQRQQQLQKLRDAHVKQFGDKPVIGGMDSFMGLTPDEVQNRIQERQERTLRRLAAAEARPAEFDPKLAQFHEKWASAKTLSGQDPYEVAPLALDDKPRVLPFKRGDS